MQIIGKLTFMKVNEDLYRLNLLLTILIFRYTCADLQLSTPPLVIRSIPNNKSSLPA